MGVYNMNIDEGAGQVTLPGGLGLSPIIVLASNVLKKKKHKKCLYRKN